jgi:hypothetical protein
VSVQQLIRERNQARTRVGVGLVIAADACVGGAWANGLREGMTASTGCATPQADQGATRVDGGLKLDRG